MSQVELTLRDFECVSTTDVGRDEVLLEVRLDGRHREPFPYAYEFQQGGVLDLDRSYVFDNEIEFSLLENDPVWDENLGTHTLETSSAMGDRVTFDEGAEYILKYDINSVSGVDPIDHAIDAFDSSDMSVVPDGDDQGMGVIWPEIEKASLVTRLFRIAAPGANPNLLDQGNTPFCGFVAVVYGLVMRQPRRLVEIARALFERGELLTVDQHVNLSDDFKTDDVPGDTEDLDWMLAGAFREATNFVFDVENDSYLQGKSSLIHAAMPWTISGLLEETLDFVNVEWVMDEKIEEYEDHWDRLARSPIPMPPRPDISKASTDGVLTRAGEAHHNSGIGIILLEKELIDGGTAEAGTSPNRITTPQYPRAEYPNHYVTCLTDNPVQGGQYNFEVQSWGGRGIVDMSRSDCEDYIWGVVRGY